MAEFVAIVRLTSSNTMKIDNLRSPREKLDGLYHFGRMLDKIRLHAAGQLPADYKLGEGDGSFWDGRLCRFLRVSYEDLKAQVTDGATDEEIVVWCHQQGREVNDEDKMILNTFFEKRGWRDPGTPYVLELKEEMGLSHRDDIQTMFDAIEVDEGRMA